MNTEAMRDVIHGNTVRKTKPMCEIWKLNVWKIIRDTVYMVSIFYQMNLFFDPSSIYVHDRSPFRYPNLFGDLLKRSQM